MARLSKAQRDQPDEPRARDEPKPLRYASISSEARRILDTHGESGRFEFKADSKAASATVLVAAANWAALDPSRDHVTILVGVEEVLDEESGLTTGRPLRLIGNDLSTHVRRIQSFAATTRPVPVDVRIIEEGVSTSAPFLRVEVRPTFPPHFDGSGRRVIRHAEPRHRALEDEELLGFYLDREAGQFEARFRGTAAETIDAISTVHDGIFDVSSELGRLPALIDWSGGRSLCGWV